MLTSSRRGSYRPQASMTPRSAANAILLLCTTMFFALSAAGGQEAADSPSGLQAAYQQRVVQRLELPPDELARYAALTRSALTQQGIDLVTSQYVAVIDRSPLVQAIMIYWLPVGAPALLIGASPVSTGRVGQFDHFETPLGAFAHTPSNPDFRAEGTKNEKGFRGYGSKGLRIYDLGWQQALRGWGKGGSSTMRLQMHATDVELAQPQLGSVQSKGCIRIPESLNRLLDHFGLLDADYETTQTQQRPLWILSTDRTPVQGAGRYVVVVDSLRAERPVWSPDPLKPV
ncbi:MULTISPECIES: L,D-transpeptidase [unclassified Variovorax]|uniref:L,D-transpeptidase n=2 Tax=Variovorax TaxID=34072 RepID=UPI002B23956E|nr:L,D-transpeptidase [Variovorax sp. LG9.2]MEB0059426.1 L,D-transpeptidase [Variovorax sp. LG9.2]